MKKLFLLLALLALLTLAACGEAVETTDNRTAETTPPTTATTTAAITDGEKTPNAFLSLSSKEMAEALLTDIGAQLTVVTETLPSGAGNRFSATDKELFSYHFFTALTDGVKEVSISQPMISNIPFFLGILKTDTAQESDALADKIDDNVNYRKLVCASFEKHYTVVYDNTVILIMDIDPARAESLYNKLTALATA